MAYIVDTERFLILESTTTGVSDRHLFLNDAEIEQALIEGRNIAKFNNGNWEVLKLDPTKKEE